MDQPQNAVRSTGSANSRNATLEQNKDAYNNGRFNKAAVKIDGGAKRGNGSSSSSSSSGSTTQGGLGL